MAQIKNGDVEWFLPDGLGSVRQLVNESSHIVCTWDYSPFGKLLGEDGDVLPAVH